MIIWLFINNPWLSVNKARLFLDKPMLDLCQLFPYWEIFIPRLGTKHSQPEKKQ